MSHQSIESNRLRLEELLRVKAQEAQAIERQLSQLNRRSSASLSASAVLGSDSMPGDYRVSSSARPNGSPLKNHERPRSSTVPRTASAAPGLKLEQHLLQDRPMKRSKTTHPVGASTTQQMMRSSSSASAHGSTRPSPSVPSATRLIIPPRSAVARNGVPSHSGMLGAFINQNQSQQPVNALMHGDAFFPDQQRQMVDLAAGGKEMDVAEFLYMRESHDYQMASPIGIPSPGLLSPHDAVQFPGNSGFSSACGSMTSQPTLETAPMTRNNSAMNDGSSFVENFEMVRIQSQHSTTSQGRHGSFGNAQHLMQHVAPGKRSVMDSDFLGMGANLPGAFPYSYPASGPTEALLAQHQHAMEKSASGGSNSSSSSSELALGPDFTSPFLADHLSMERSNSKDSNASLKFRAKEALARQNVNAAKSRHLKPKPACDAVKKESVDTSTKGKDGKAPISKAKYERPKHPKVQCHQCNENPEGFRGEHELRRHTEAKHKLTVKKWICRDPALFGIPHAETATKPLSECKHCSQRKLYGAYYNAAAHLRRTHFRVKPNRKGLNAKNGSKGSPTTKTEDKRSQGGEWSSIAEKRGGNGGGDWPAMTELKLWMVEVTVPMDQESLTQDSSMDAAIDPEDFEGDMYDAPFPYDNTFAGVGSGFPSDHLHGLDPSLHSLQRDLAHQAPDLFPIDTMYASSSMHTMPLSSSGFAFGAVSDHPMQQSHAMASSMMSMDSHGYTSPVSSTATITQTGLYNDHHMLAGPTMHAREDLADMSFDLTFSAVAH